MGSAAAGSAPWLCSAATARCRGVASLAAIQVIDVFAVNQHEADNLVFNPGGGRSR
jgi:hypothetical protein